MELARSIFGINDSQSSAINFVSSSSTKKTKEELDKEVADRLSKSYIGRPTEPTKKYITEIDSEDDDLVDDNLPDPRPLESREQEEVTDDKKGNEENLHLPPLNKAKKIEESEKIRYIESIASSQELFTRSKVFSIDFGANDYSDRSYFNFDNSLFELSDGSFYRGFWYQKKRNGRGVQIFIRDDRYIHFEGYFQDDVPVKTGIIKTYKFNPDRKSVV